MTPAELAGTWGQCPSLWWPADRAWCVATDVDLPWTYVGGPRGLIDAIAADRRIEALPASPGDPVSRVEDWVPPGSTNSPTTCWRAARPR